MRKLFAIIFGIVLLFAISLIISLIPIKQVGDEVSKYAKKYDIKISTISNWNFRLFGAQAITNNFIIETKIGEKKTKLSGKGENFSYSFIGGNVKIDSLNVDIFIDESTELTDLIESVKKELEKSKTYSFVIDNLILTIHKRYNADEEYKVYSEIILTNIELIKKKKKTIYNIEIGINKDKTMKIFTSTDNLGTEFYDINAKINNDNLTCYLYDAKNKGELKCNIKNLYELTKDFDIGIEDSYYKTILNKKITINANIEHNNGNFTISGRTNVNKDNGKIVYNSKNNEFELTFDKLDFDSEENDINDILEEENKELKENEQKMAMSGKENKIINSVSKKNKRLDINSLNKTALILLKLSKMFGFNFKSQIKQATLNNTKVKNIIVDLTKNKNSEQININEFSLTFGSKKSTKFTSTEEGLSLDFDSFDNILIKYENNRVGNLLVSGSNIAGFVKLFKLTNIKPDFESGKYFITGDVKLTTNSINLDNIELVADDKKIFSYDSNTKYNFEKQAIEQNKIIKITDLKLDDYFTFDSIYKKIYSDFVNFQANNKQDAIFWKKLFDKHNGEENNGENKNVIVINNSSFYSENITNLAITFENRKIFDKLNIVSQSDFANGEFDFDIRQIAEKETITSKIKTNFINLASLDAIFADLELATGKKVKDVFFDNKDYNIPSFVGLNGEINVDIDNLIINSRRSAREILSTIYLKDGVFEAKDMQFKYGNGDISANINFTLQNIPDLQIGLSASGLNIDDIVDSPLDGYISTQCSLKSRGFNPYSFIHDINGKCSMVVQNLYIPKFDLLNTSNYIITHGLQKSYNYGSMIGKNSLAFQKGTGSLLLEKGKIKGDIAMARELISGSAEFEYSFDTGLLNKLAGSFVMMVAREKLETPFPIYIPIACNGKPIEPECLVNWQQFEEVLNSK